MTALDLDADRRLLREVIAWGRNNGWEHRTYELGPRTPGQPRDIEHVWDDDGHRISLWRGAISVTVGVRTLPDCLPDSVRQAVDLLVDLDALPPHLHSLHVDLAAVEIELERQRRDHGQDMWNAIEVATGLKADNERLTRELAACRAGTPFGRKSFPATAIHGRNAYYATDPATDELTGEGVA
jgi:hypothetical protein